MKKLLLLTAILLVIIVISCKKNTDNNYNQNNDPCNGVTVNVTATPASSSACNPANGSISVTTSGGTAPFTYQIGGGPFQSNANFTGLAAGNYTVTAKDANGCTGSATVTVGSSTPTINVTATPSNVTSCSSNNGSISASATGSTGFTFSINGTTFQASGNFTGLAAGNYTITAKDANGCTGTGTATVGTSTPAINVTATPSNVTSCSSNNGSISASATGSTGFTFSINGTTFQASGNFTGLAAGNYTITAKDANGCTGTGTATVGTSTPAINVTATPSNVTSCSSSNGSISASATGSTGFTFSINGTTFQASGNFTGLAAGNYTITAKDANGCTGTRAVSVGTNTPTITVTPNVTPVVPCGANANNGSVIVSASGGASPYQFSFNGGAFSANPTLPNQAAGNVTAQAKDANGCLSSNITVSIGTASAGPLFTSVKNIITNRCGGCHISGSSGGMSFSTDCNIISAKARIQARAVTQGTMPPSGAIPSSEQQAITNWINAGGQFNQ